MNILPDEIIVEILSYGLNLRDLNSCSQVCRRWFNLIADFAPQWKQWLHAAVTDKKLAEEVYSELIVLSVATSWKVAFVCYYALQTKKQPLFWNDYNFFLLCSKLQIKDDMWKHYHLPCNVNFWMMLQLNIGPKGISSPLAKDELNHEAFKYMNKYMLVLNQSMGASNFLTRLKQIADVPQHGYFSLNQYHVSTLLLLHILSGCPNRCSEDTHHYMCKSLTEKDWEDHFVLPVQKAVLKVLQHWTKYMCGENELGVCIRSQTLPQWLDQFSKETFWVVSVQPIHEAVENVVRKQNPLRCVSSPCNIDCTWLLEKRVSAKDVATRMTSICYKQFLEIPTADLMRYLTLPSQESSPRSVKNWLLHSCSDNISKIVVALCRSETSRKKKATLVHNLIAVCCHLIQLRNFHCAKPLLSLIRTVVGQSHISSLTWKDVKIRDCKKFKEMEELMNHKNGYSNYLRHVKDLQQIYIPYLPAHQQVCRNNISQPASSFFDILVLESTCYGLGSGTLRDCSYLSYLYVLKPKEILLAEYIEEYYVCHQN